MKEALQPFTLHSARLIGRMSVLSAAEGASATVIFSGHHDRDQVVPCF